jgi:preprotein translocase subunit SecB
MVQYVRDLSFENPGAPNFAAGQNPEIGVNANVGARKLSDTDYEVGLKFRIEAKAATEGEDEAVQFIAELEYCGVFRLLNVAEADVKPVLLIEAPRQLFPFARRVLADATRDGGYPPIMLDPIDFMALYQQSEAGETADEPLN